MGKCRWKTLKRFFSMSEKTTIESEIHIRTIFLIFICLWGCTWHSAHVVLREELRRICALLPLCRSQGLNSGPPGLVAGAFIHRVTSQAHISLLGYFKSQILSSEQHVISPGSLLSFPSSLSYFSNHITLMWIHGLLYPLLSFWFQISYLLSFMSIFQNLYPSLNKFACSIFMKIQVLDMHYLKAFFYKLIVILCL